MAGRGTDIKLGAGVVDRGGLFILGTERHESRRIDRQLRGRSGRQGDPGTTRFYLSLEDDLMRLFGSDRMASVMQRMGLKEGEVIQHPLITKSVERAQKKVEENNFSIRKRLLEYDNVMNQQREIIYSRRNRALVGERLKSEIFEMLDEYAAELIEKYFDDANIEKIREDLLHHLMIDFTIDPERFLALGKDGLTAEVSQAAKDFYRMKEERLGADLMARLEQFAFLTVIDQKWKEHLREMDDLKEGIGLRSYGQKDPLIEYKGEAYKMFVELIDTIRNETVMLAFKLTPIAPEDVQTSRRRPTRGRMVASKSDTDRIGYQSGAQPEPPSGGRQQPVRVEERVGRNDPCPCGSGKKYKQCHGK
jgi:preprotein translocase subunit SecA